MANGKSWLDGLLGRIFSRDVELELSGGTNYANPLRATQNPLTGRIDVSLDYDELPITVGDLAGQSLKLMRVNAGETDVEWTNTPEVTSITTANNQGFFAKTSGGVPINVCFLDSSNNLSFNKPSTASSVANVGFHYSGSFQLYDGGTEVLRINNGNFEPRTLGLLGSSTYPFTAGYFGSAGNYATAGELRFKSAGSLRFRSPDNTANNYLLEWNATTGDVEVGTESVPSGGTEGDTRVRAGRQVQFRTAANTRWFIHETGYISPVLHNTYDIGQSSLRVKKIYGVDTDFTGQSIRPWASAAIASGVITYIAKRMIVDTEAAAAFDDLVTINGGSDGAELIITGYGSGHQVRLLETGNIQLPAAYSQLVIPTVAGFVGLSYKSSTSKWHVEWWTPSECVAS